MDTYEVVPRSDGFGALLIQEEVARNSLLLTEKDGTRTELAFLGQGAVFRSVIAGRYDVREMDWVGLRGL